MGHGIGSFAELLQVFEFTVCDDLGETVGGHQYGDVIAFCWRYGVQSLGYAKGESINEGGEGVPCPGYSHRQTGSNGLSRFVQGSVVATHDVRGVLGREDDGHDLLDALAGQLSKALFYEGRGMTHADADFGGLVL